MRSCNNKKCSTSTGICGHLTFGSGRLDDYGYWSRPCNSCARAYEQENPHLGKCWPFAHPSHVDHPGYEQVYDRLRSNFYTETERLQSGWTVTLKGIGSEVGEGLFQLHDPQNNLVATIAPDIYSLEKWHVFVEEDGCPCIGTFDKHHLAIRFLLDKACAVIRHAKAGERGIVKRVINNKLIFETSTGEIYIECSSNPTAMQGLDGYKGEEAEIASEVVLVYYNELKSSKEVEEFYFKPVNETVQ